LKAVDGIDLEVAPGEVYGFLGPNGAGKTTTVRMLVTLLLPTGGRASVAGYDVATQPAQVRKRIGVALQEAALDPLMTGAELIGRVGLSQAADRRVGQYSGGMRRRLTSRWCSSTSPRCSSSTSRRPAWIRHLD
jgi:ABC-2 type transport system ATP-binding protein